MKNRILVVDDDREMCSLFSFIFEREGYEVIAANSGEEAMACALSSAPAVILLDVMMPDHNGLDVCRWLKSNDQTQAVPVILITAYSHVHHRSEALKVGAVDLISKPFSPYALIARVRTALQSRWSTATSEGFCYTPHAC
jgi:DNA-binding response OmpR family regulator